MRWIPFVILTYVLMLIQTTLGRVVTIDLQAVGLIGPDLAAIAAVFIAAKSRTELDAVLAAWVLGLALDLTAAAGPGATTVIGPMALAYAAAAWVVFRVRDAFFRERVTTQAFLALVFCGLAHFLWVSMQCLLAGRGLTWGEYGRLLGQAGGLAIYTAVLTPAGFAGLSRIQRWLFAVAPDRGARRRR